MSPIPLWLALVSCALVGQQTSARSIFGHYLQLPNEESLREEPFHLNVSEAIRQLDLERDQAEGLVLARLRERLAETNLEASMRKIYEQFVSLASVEEKPAFCSLELVKLSKSVLAQLMTQHSMSMINFYQFFHHFARRKFEHCTKNISDRLDLLPGWQVEQTLDDFFTHAVDEFNRPDIFIYRLQQLNLESGHFNATGMLRAANRWRSHGAHAKDRPMTLMRNFLDSKCALMFEYFGRTLDVVNLAIALDWTVQIPSRLQKLNEYNRLCSVWRDPNRRRKVVRNIRSQLMRR